MQASSSNRPDMNINSRQCQIWVRSEVMTFGVLATPPHPRLGINNLRKLIIYCKQKAKGAFPMLSYTMWKHVACTKLQLTEEFSWLLFENALQFVSNSPEQLTEIDRMRSMHMVGSLSYDDFQTFLNNLTVNVISFATFLYLQQVHRISLRGSLSSLTRDEWPKLAAQRSLSASNLTSDDSMLLSGASTPPNGANSSWNSGSNGTKYEETAHFQFVQTNLAELFELCCVDTLISVASASSNSSSNTGDSEKQTERKSALTHGNIAATHLDAVSYLFAAYDDAAASQNGPPSLRRRVRSLIEVLTADRNAIATGYDRSRRSFAYATLVEFLRRNLIVSPFGISSCVTGRRLSWLAPVLAPSVDVNELNFSANSSASTSIAPRGKVATNALNVHPDAVDGHKLILMTQVTRQVLARSSSTLEHATIKIHRSHYSFIYLLSPVRAVSIEKCRGTTVVIGAAECSISVTQCDGCTIVCTARRVSLGASRRCTVHALTPTQPLIFVGCEQIVLAPFHTFYARLEVHMRAARLCATPTLWMQPFQFTAQTMNASGSNSSSQAQAQAQAQAQSNSQSQERCWELLPPRDFYRFTIPFEFDELERLNSNEERVANDAESLVTKDIPGSLPSEYQMAVLRRERQLHRWRTDVQAAQLSDAQQDRLRQLVQERFQAWLIETGQQRHLEYLSKMA